MPSQSLRIVSHRPSPQPQDPACLVPRSSWPPHTHTRTRARARWKTITPLHGRYCPGPGDRRETRGSETMREYRVVTGHHRGALRTHVVTSGMSSRCDGLGDSPAASNHRPNAVTVHTSRPEPPTVGNRWSILDRNPLVHSGPSLFTSQTSLRSPLSHSWEFGPMSQPARPRDGLCSEPAPGVHCRLWSPPRPGVSGPSLGRSWAVSGPSLGRLWIVPGPPPLPPRSSAAPAGYRPCIASMI